jgi:signal transduction histidine kinase/CheY-like chemotaxis protein
VQARLFDSDLWEPALDKFAEVTGLAVELFGADGKPEQGPVGSTALVKLFRRYGYEPGLFAECARRCLLQTGVRSAVTVADAHRLTVVGTSLMLEGRIVGAAVGGYAIAGFSQVAEVQRWAESAAVPFDALWDIARRQAPVPERRLLLHGELLQVLGDTLLRENHRTRQYEDMVAKLEAAATAKDEFLAVVSHELRSPLAPILGWAGVLKKDQSPELVQRAAEAIERNVLLQARLVDDLLDMNLTERGMVKLDLVILDLAACVRAVLETATPDIEQKGLRLEVVDTGKPLFIEADAGRLQQIFSNIISNAVKFTPDGGGIRVAITTQAGDAEVVVTDTGSGIAPAFLPFVFDMFRQQESGTQRGYQGLGIGLALVKKLAELQKGSVTVTSAGTGRGTEVTVRFPRAPAPDLREPAASTTQAPPATLGGLAILVVDDIEDTRESMRTMLQQLGATVYVAGDGSAGLDMVRNASPDLVLCDLRMPRMDGFEFIREMHRRILPPHPPVLALTALASSADRERTRKAGFDGHICKPCDEATLVAAVEAALHSRPHAGHAAMSVAGGRG